MNPKTKDPWFEILKKRSVILHPPDNNSKTPPKVSRAIFGLTGMRNELDAILNDERDSLVRFIGSLPAEREFMKQEVSEWKALS